MDELIALAQRRGKALNDSELLRRARGRYALLLNEDSELLPGATLALWQALDDDPRAACAGARLLRPDGTAQASAWRFPTPLTALAGALFLHRLLDRAEQRRRAPARSTGASRRRCSCGARRPQQVGYLDPDFFVYSDEVDFARRLRDAGWRSVYVPAARRRSTTSSSRPARVPERRIVELARNRDLYMRKHHSPRPRWAVRWLTAWAYARARARGARAARARSPRRYWRHVTATLQPERGEGLREAAERYNRA